MRKSIIFLLIISIGVLFVISGCAKTEVGQKISSSNPEVKGLGDSCPGKCKVENMETGQTVEYSCMKSSYGNCGCSNIPLGYRVLTSNCGEIS